MMGAPVAKARDFKGTMRKLIEYLGAYRLPIIIVWPSLPSPPPPPILSVRRSSATPPPNSSKV
jgi:hypothetical protein